MEMGLFSVLRVLLGFPFLLFLPGFALTLALWPRTKGEVFGGVVDILEKGKTREVAILGREEEAEGLIALLEERSFRVALMDPSPERRKEEEATPIEGRAWVLMERLDEAGLKPDRFEGTGIGEVIDLRDNPLQGDRLEDTVDGVERAILSLGLSLAIVPLMGLVLDHTPFGIRPWSVFASLSLLILFLLGVCRYRRRERWPSWNASR